MPVQTSEPPDKSRAMLMIMRVPSMIVSVRVFLLVLGVVVMRIHCSSIAAVSAEMIDDQSIRC